MEALWIDMYERGYVEEADVLMVQAWLAALEEVGYTFPLFMAPARHRDVAVMGQFNYASDPAQVVFWAQKWRYYFDHVAVAGPFSEEQLQALHGHGIVALRGRDDFGYTSPLENLSRALSLYREQEGITGVLYTHDDAFYHMERLAFGQHPFPTDQVIAVFSPECITPDCVDMLQWTNESQLFHPNGELHQMNNWPHWKKVTPGLEKVRPSRSKVS